MTFIPYLPFKNCLLIKTFGKVLKVTATEKLAALSYIYLFLRSARPFRDRRRHDDIAFLACRIIFFISPREVTMSAKFEIFQSLTQTKGPISFILYLTLSVSRNWRASYVIRFWLSQRRLRDITCCLDPRGKIAHPPLSSDFKLQRAIMHA